MTRNDENNALFCAETVENHAICSTENVENHAIFVEGFWLDFYARGRLMKYSMSAHKIDRFVYTDTFWSPFIYCVIHINIQLRPSLFFVVC